MSSCQVWFTVNNPPACRCSCEKAHHGRLGTTTSNESSGSAPWRAGSVSSGMSSRKRVYVSGKPCVRISGIGRGPLARSWMKWISAPLTSATYCANPLSRASCARQSYFPRQYSSSSRRYTGLAPASHSAGPCSGGSRVVSSRVRRSASTVPSTRISKGLGAGPFMMWLRDQHVFERHQEILELRGVFAREFPGAEMPTARHFGPAHDIERAFGEPARRRSGQVFREQCQSHRPFDERPRSERGLARLLQIAVDR